MLNLKSIAATLAVLGSGAALTACGGSQTKATEVPGAQAQPGNASCAASGNCGANKGAGQGAKPEGSCSAKKDEHSCGAKKPGAGDEGSCGAKTSEAPAASSPVSTAVADTTTSAPTASAAAPVAPSKPPRKAAAKKPKHGEAACGEGSCA